jgi:uncharacterized coiled-coil protein SlyX
LEHKLTEAKR